MSNLIPATEWGIILGHVSGRIEGLRLQLETQHNPEATAVLRGRILELREIIRWGEEEQAIPPEVFAGIDYRLDRRS